MARPTTKTDLIEASNNGYESLMAFIDSMAEQELTTPFDFSQDEKKKEAHWQRDKNLRDILIHLYEWHNLTLDWVSSNQKGEEKPLLPKPYTWRTYGQMNMLLEQSHREIMQLVECFSNEQLFLKGVFDWVGNSPLGSYFVSNTSSHYVWALKKLKAHRKVCSNLL